MISTGRGNFGGPPNPPSFGSNPFASCAQIPYYVRVEHALLPTSFIEHMPQKPEFEELQVDRINPSSMVGRPQ